MRKRASGYISQTLNPVGSVRSVPESCKLMQALRCSRRVGLGICLYRTYGFVGTYTYDIGRDRSIQGYHGFKVSGSKKEGCPTNEKKKYEECKDVIEGV